MSGSDAEAHAVWSEVDLDAIRANVARPARASRRPPSCSRW